mgnify:CR=1 FL=1
MSRKSLHEEKLSSRNPAGRGAEEPLSAVIEPTEEDDPSLDGEYMSHVKHHFEENRIRSIVRKVLINERMESDIYKVVVQNIHRNGPMDHQELLRKVLSNFPMLSDEEIDGYIDNYADTGAILYDPRIQKYY